MDWIARELPRSSAVRVHGKLSYEDRNRALARFKEDPECKFLVATPGSAKEGLTLTVANHAIFYDRSFSLDDYLQAQDRIHRISQVKTCFVTNLIAKDTVLFEPDRVNLRQRMEHVTDAIHRRMEELLKDESAGSISERVSLRNALTTLADLQKITYARRPSGSVRRERGQAISP